MNTIPTGFQVLKDNIYTIITGDYNEGSTSLDLLSNVAIMRLDRKFSFPSFRDVPKLTEEQKESLDEFWRPYVRHMDDKFHRLMTSLHTWTINAITPNSFPRSISREQFACV